MTSATAVTISPARGVSGRLEVPGDKSIAHRYALIAALADGASRLSNFAPGADCHSTLGCLASLGVEIREDRHAKSVTLNGRGFRDWCSPAGPLDAGNSGTTMRMMAGLLAAQSFTVTMIGDESLSRRPMRRVIEPLSRMGARIDATEGHAPLVIHGGPLHGIAFTPEVPSAQVKSAVLLAGLHADGTTSVTEPAQTRDHTERALSTFGYDVQVAGLTTTVRGGQRGHARSVSIPGDFSSAAFWLVAAAALPGSRIEVTDVGLNPTRTGLLAVLRRYGAHINVAETTTEAGEPRGTIVVVADQHKRVEIAPEEVPGLIDELPAIAALAAHSGEVVVRGAQELRVKESDRIATLVTGFRALGVEAEEYGDGFAIHGTGALRGGVAHAQG
ncbi:MAG: 3-phosphoshikimate 1-carboxyvinyltransferase, partial [Vicinamibacterales bacterium]